MTGSKRRGDYCWSLYSGRATHAPWYLGGQPFRDDPKPDPKPDPSPEDSQEIDPVRPR